MPANQFSRRSFIGRLCVMGTAAWAGWGSRIGRSWGEDLPPGTKPKGYPSHGPRGRWLENSEELIDQLIRPQPQGRRVSEHIAASTRLENVFCIDLGKHAVLIDTGFDHQVDHHLDNLQTLGCDLSRIVAILATHSHVDHTGGLKRARERLGVPVIAHPRAVKPISTGDLLQTAAVIPEVKGWEFAFPACPVDETLDHGDVIQIADQRIDVFHIPGHTPDSLGYVWNGHFFTGDAVFGAGLIGWANERWLSNYTDHAETMLGLLQSKPDAQVFSAAHGQSLPYSAQVPEACLKTLNELIANDGDPCNHTPRITRRAADDAPKTLTLPLS
jgi:glyoxylase-like metal-dependent hydrolase (beta-lactamase superfamily II)